MLSVGIVSSACLVCVLSAVTWNIRETSKRERKRGRKTERERERERERKRERERER